jgi:uncharacterized protein
MKIAVIGSGISGLVCAYLLSDGHEVTVFEANDYIGGHTHTVPVTQDGRHYAVDTGFIVFNDRTYPNFCKLLQKLNVRSMPTTMSFALRCDRTGLEYNSASFNGLFAQRNNLFRPSFYGMLLEVLRFNREAKAFLHRRKDISTTLKAFLDTHKFGKMFREKYLLPMMAAIWSADPKRVHEFPALSFLQFFENHGLLSVKDQPQWRVVRGGSSRYIEKMLAAIPRGVRLQTPIESIRRYPDRVEVFPHKARAETFDHVVLAVHSDQALAMLADPSGAEEDILGAIPYQRNHVVLHTDAEVLPKRRNAWGSWNYRIPENPQAPASISYNMNMLQGLNAPETFVVSLNYTGAIAPDKVKLQLMYQHPVYTWKGLAVQKRHSEISGVFRTHYCGAYWGYGFHEDGVKSALAVCQHFKKQL